MRAFIIRAILLLRKNFSHFAVFFSCSFPSHRPEFGQKELPVDSCTNIESSHATASKSPSEPMPDRFQTKCWHKLFWKWKTFLNRTIRKILSSPMKLWSRYRVSELEERIISEGSFVNANIYWHLKNMEELNIERWIRIWKTFPPVCKIQYFSSTIDIKESVKCVLSKVLCRGSLRRRWGFTEREHIQKTFLFPCCWMNIFPFLKVFSSFKYWDLLTMEIFKRCFSVLLL